MQLRYGMNPHQDASITLPPGAAPVRVISGAPSAINVLDALSGWQLVREVAAATGAPAAASFKHVSPAGVAVAGQLDLTAQGTWSPGASPGPLTSAYIRARDADPKSSFGDMIAVSEPVDAELAAFLGGVVADGIIAPGFEPGAAGLLAAKKRGSFLVLEADAAYQPPASEQRDVFGLVLEQQRDAIPITAASLAVAGGPLPAAAVTDALTGLITLRYTQSNSVTLIGAGATLAVAAGQQNRVDCVRLAAAKAATWRLRRHQAIRDLPVVPGMTRQDRLNWQTRLADGDMTPWQAAEFGLLFPGTAASAAGTRRLAGSANRSHARLRWLPALQGQCRPRQPDRRPDHRGAGRIGPVG